MLRINRNRIDTVFKQSQDIDSLLKTAPDTMFAACPFTIILGALNTTEAGYKPPNLIVNNYTNFQKVFTGRESVLCVWDNCYELDQVRTPTDKGGDETNNYGIVKVRQFTDGSNGGDRFYGRISESAVMTNFKPSSTNESMTGMSATKTVNLLFSYGGNEKLFDEITNNIYKFWMLPELFQFKDSRGKGYLSTDRQWYYLENCILIYDSNTKEPTVLQATFVSVNDVIAKSGLAINQYVQVSAPGDRCCIPTVKDKLIVCDEEFLKYRPITHVQISLFGNASLSSIVFMGRPATSWEQPQTTWKIEAPRFIFPHIYQASSYDEMFVNAVPETNYYLLINSIPTIITGFNDWKDTISATYNQFMSKQYEGFLAVDINKTKLTNQDTNVGTGLHYQYWDPRFLQDKSLWPDNTYNVGGSEYYNINPNKQSDKIQYSFCGETQIKPPSAIDGTKYSLAILNIASFFTHKQFYQLPLEVTQTTPVAISSIPILGKFLNYLILGLPVGFRLTSNILTPRIPAVLSLFSAEQFELLTSIFSTSSKNNIPLDVFRKDTTSDIYSMCGTTSQTTSFCFNLSNQMTLKPTKIDGTIPDYKDIKHANYNPSITIDSVKLGQINVDKNEAYLLGGLIDLEKLKINNGFIIDSFVFQALGQVPYRITFYSQPDNPQGNLDNKNSVWTGVYTTLSTASQNTRQWTNFMVLSNPQYNFKENFYYPQNVEGAPIEGEITKYLIENFNTYEKRIIIGQNDLPTPTNLLTIDGTIYLPAPYPIKENIGYVYKINDDSWEDMMVIFKIDDLDLGLEKYKAKSVTIVLNPIKGKVFTTDIFTWGNGDYNLSAYNNTYIWWVHDSDYLTSGFYATDPGKNGEQFKDLNNEIISQQSITIDLTNLDDEIFDLSSDKNVLNTLPETTTQGVYQNYIRYGSSFWNYGNIKGEYLNIHLNENLDSYFYVLAIPQTNGYALQNSTSGMMIYFLDIQQPKLIVRKVRNEVDKQFIIRVFLQARTTCGADCFLEIYNYSWVIQNRDLIYHNLKYYIDQGQVNSMNYGVATATDNDPAFDNKIKVVYEKEDNNV